MFEALLTISLQTPTTWYVFNLAISFSASMMQNWRLELMCKTTDVTSQGLVRRRWRDYTCHCNGRNVRRGGLLVHDLWARRLLRFSYLSFQSSQVRSRRSFPKIVWRLEGQVYVTVHVFKLVWLVRTASSCEYFLAQSTHHVQLM